MPSTFQQQLAHLAPDKRQGTVGDEVTEGMEPLIEGLVDRCKAFDFYSE